ncbi:60S ribosomal protein L27 [Intoshia linei]|uniref:Large ribosomal subunit protein eL27 n=1 Tax=Intoshia linei TaxID=1819745 RepID=A0A177AZS1_9BILA|nr:60S ribosomal protein L27 [Intoshia linei]
MQSRPILKKNRVVILLSGRHAGKKAVVLKCYDQGTTSRKFGCALVVGVERAPRKVTKSMSKSKILRQTRMKTFIKCVNYSHILPTRFV